MHLPYDQCGLAKASGGGDEAQPVTQAQPLVQLPDQPGAGDQVRTRQWNAEFCGQQWSRNQTALLACPSTSLWGVDEPALQGHHRGLGPVRDIQLLQDGADIVAHRARRKVQTARNLGIGVSPRQQSQDV